MKPIKTAEANAKFVLEGGTQDNDLPLEQAVDEDGNPLLRSVWELTDEEREAISNGACVYLLVWGAGTPPVALGVEGVEPT